MKKLIAIAALMCGTAQAEFFTGNDLLGKINGESVVDRMIGLGYVMGVYDVGAGAIHCPPDHVTAGQVRDMVKGHLEASASTRHLAADTHVRYVLTSAWPCKKKGGGT